MQVNQNQTLYRNIQNIFPFKGVAIDLTKKAGTTQLTYGDGTDFASSEIPGSKLVFTNEAFTN